MKNMIHVGIVGFGGMGNMHRQMINEGIRADKRIGQVPNMRVTGSFDILAQRQEYARKHGLHVYESLQEMLDDPQLDMIICATPNDVHKDIVIRALEAGKHVMCEKPATLSVSDFDEMTAAAQSAGKLLTVGQNRRWDEDFTTVRALYSEGQLGRINCIESRVHGSRGIPGDWRKLKKHGGGMLLDWGVHLLDQALYMIPEKVVRVSADLTYSPASECDDGIRVMLMFESGLRYYVEVGTSHYIPMPRWYVLGAEGTAVIHNWSMEGKMVCIVDQSRNDAQPVHAASGITKTMAPRTDDTIVHLPLPKRPSDVSAMYNNIAGAILNDEELVVKPCEVRRVLRLIETIQSAAAQQQILPFE